MRKLLTINIGLLTAFAMIFLLGTVISAIYGRDGTHLFINNYHSVALDQFMKLWTHLGDGTFLAGLAIVLFFIKIRFGFIFLSSFFISSFIVQLLKRTIFAGMPRPLRYFECSGIDIHVISGLKYNYFNSFPSGHSATAFALFIGLALLSKNQLLKVFLLVLACSVAFSRVYLSQHFLVDIIFGSLIGVICAILSHWYFHYLDRQYLGLPIYKILRKT